MMGDLYSNWARVYDCFYPDRSGEVAFWTKIAASYGKRVLDLMCGTAEVSLGLSQNGLRLAGVDRSPAMLEVAASRLHAFAGYSAHHVSLVEADACALPLSFDSFDFVLVGGSGSFNHLEDDSARIALLELMRVLRPGGGLGMELVNPGLLDEIDPQWTLRPFRSPGPEVRLEKTITNRYDPSASKFLVHQETLYDIDGQQGQFEESFDLRIWTPCEVGTMLANAGFERVQLYGDYAQAQLTRWSADMVVLATSGEFPAQS